MTCPCHGGDVYASLVACPGCRHRSFDPIAEACERRACGYEAPERPRPAEPASAVQEVLPL